VPYVAINPEDGVPTPYLFSVNEAARLLGIGRTKCFELLGSEELPSVRIGRRRLVHRDAIRDYAARLAAFSDGAA
jgi:excisionase family DNA binding protein